MCCFFFIETIDKYSENMPRKPARKSKVIKVEPIEPDDEEFEVEKIVRKRLILDKVNLNMALDITIEQSTFRTYYPPTQFRAS